MIAEHKRLRNLQMIQYDMLKIVDAICKKYDIKYYLAYGTLLGAVRHKASIPWDYDIDIAMKRKEYNKFREAFANEVKELELIDVCYSSIEYASLSRVIKRNVQDFGNVHIDIFILDYARNYSPLARKYVGGAGRFLQIAKLSKEEKAILYDLFKENKKKLFVVKLGDFFCKIFSGSGIEKFHYKMQVSGRKTSNMIILEDPHRIIKTEYLQETVYLQYEDQEFPVPKKYDELLKLWYGNYMEIPEEGKRYLEKEREAVSH